MSLDIHWRCLPFEALKPLELYELLRLRSEVFVVEQACLFQDMDGADPACHHLVGERDGALVAYARLVPAALKFAEPSIGRVVSEPTMRGTGLGHVLMREAVHRVQLLWGVQPMRIGAQARLEAFYRQHGFVPDGAAYIEDGIDHIEMLRR